MLRGEPKGRLCRRLILTCSMIQNDFFWFKNRRAKKCIVISTELISWHSMKTTS